MDKSIEQYFKNTTLESRDEIFNEVRKFYVWNFNPDVQKELSVFFETSTIKEEELKQRFCKRMQFGTAGLRAIMGVGFSYINDLTILQTTQGLCQYLIDKHGCSKCSKYGVVIGFDGRFNSHRYSHVCACVFLSKGFKVYLSSKTVHTPTIPFTVLKKNCVAGVQITASHNPAEYNGYKVYSDNGCQIVSPIDIGISDNIVKNLEPWTDALKLIDDSTGFLKDTSELVDYYDEIVKLYLSNIKNEIHTFQGSLEPNDPKFTYTALHGVGYPFINGIMNVFGFEKIINYVEKQKNPDPYFPTVKFPNPEEKNALDLAFEVAEENHSSFVIANDPDADRFASAEFQDNGLWKIFTGDEIGILLAYDALERLKESGWSPSSLVFICSAVSSRMLKKMAETENCKFDESMTGFKFLMKKANEYKNTKYKIALVYEEALGYALNMNVPDKDGVSAAAAWVQMALKCYRNGYKVSDQLLMLHKKYGFFVNNNSYFTCYDPETIKRIFQEFRSNGSLLKQIGIYVLKRVRDVHTGFDNGEKDNKCTFPQITSEMLTLFFENNAVVTIRTSGTEPKIKWYSEMSGSDPETVKLELDQLIECVLQYVLQPDKFSLR